MKCKYCNSEIEQDAQFCTKCGKDLSKFIRCSKCGELIDDSASFCPYCGTEKQKDESEEPRSKKWLWFICIILLFGSVGGGIYFYVAQNDARPSSSNRETEDNILATDKEEAMATRNIAKEEMNSAVEKHGLKPGYYKDVHFSFHFMIPQFLRDGVQEGDLHKDNSTLYENKDYSMYISVEKTDMESVLWMYDTLRGRYGEECYDESMKTIKDNYIIADDNDGSILLIMKSSEMCGYIYFIYPEGGKDVADETIKQTLEATMEAQRR